MLIRDRDRGVAGEGRPSGQQLIQQAPGRVQVAAGIDPLAPCLLGGQVLRGADDLGRLRHRGLRVADGPGDAEVHHLDVPGPGQHHVAGLDVPVHDAVAVAVVKRPQHAVEDLHRPFRQQPAVFPQQVAQGAAVDVLHHDVGDRGGAYHVLAGVVDSDDRRVVQRRRGLGLAAEPGLEGLVPGEVLAERLDRHDAIQTDVSCPVDLGHAAAPDDAVELVAAAEQPGLGHVSHVKLPSRFPFMKSPGMPG